jgi:hypothetical protein
MHVFGAFELDIRPGTPDHPASVKIALLRYARGEDGRLFITPSVHPSRRSRGRSTRCRTSWTRCATEPAACTRRRPRA